MQPFVEKIFLDESKSLALFERTEPDSIPFEWHHHPEIELTLTLNSYGRRYIGDHIENYYETDLVLVGKGTPHTWASCGKYDENKPHKVYVVWFRSAWLKSLIELCPELISLAKLIETAQGALVFSPALALSVKAQILSLFELPQVKRLPVFISIMTELSQSSAKRIISPLWIRTSQDERLDRVLNYLNKNYHNKVSVEKLAALANLSESAFYKLFKQHTRITPKAYISQLRIGRACQLLSHSDKKIALVANQVGYFSLAQFNKEFKRLKKQTPLQFRNQQSPQN
nr:AraC family transcriptional regulator [Gayadomonas joobiniege]